MNDFSEYDKNLIQRINNVLLENKNIILFGENNISKLKIFNNIINKLKNNKYLIFDDISSLRKENKNKTGFFYSKEPFFLQENNLKNLLNDEILNNYEVFIVK